MARARAARYGEGSIYQTAEGRWRATLKGLDGKRHYISARTRADVVRALEEAKALARDGKPMPAARLKLGRYLRDWLQDTAKPRMRPLTYRYTEQKLRAHVVPALGEAKLAELTTPMIQRQLNTLSKTLAPKTVKHVRDILRGALNDAVACRLIPYNAAQAASAPRVIKRHVEPLTLLEAKQLLGAVESHRLRALFTVGLACGLRAAEALGLRWEDLDLECSVPVLHVRNTLQRIDGQWQLNEPKTESSRRTIPLPAVAVKALSGHRKRQLGERLKAGNKWRQPLPELVFTDPLGQPVMGQNLSRTFSALLVKAGLPERRFHDLRHACCSLLLAQGVPPSTVMEILGHSNMTTTMHIYREVSQAAMREGVKALDFLAS